MALGISGEIAGAHVNDASFIDIPFCDMSAGNEIAEPACGERVVLIVVSPHGVTHGKPSG